MLPMLRVVLTRAGMPGACRVKSVKRVEVNERGCLCLAPSVRSSAAAENEACRVQSEVNKACRG